jgi:hypothetical protein
VPIDGQGLVSRRPPEATPPRWTFDGGAEGFYSSHLSGAQRLPNGNTLLTVGNSGALTEYAADGSVAWRARVVQPAALQPLPTGATGLFRATRLALDHPGVAVLREER